MAAADKPVTREDLEAKFRAVQGDMQSKLDDKKPSLLTGAVIGGVLLLLLVFLIGKRSGKKKTTLVEIRRV
jgi:hypothetical protein